MENKSHVPNGPKSSWLEQAKEIIAVGYPSVADKLPDLVAWLQDINWPGAREISDFLSSIGEPVIPHVKSVLQGNDRIWQYWVLWSVVNQWPHKLVAELEDDLLKLIWLTNVDEVDIAALRQLAKHHLGDSEDLKRAITRKRQSFEDLLGELDEIGQFMQQTE